MKNNTLGLIIASIVSLLVAFLCLHQPQHKTYTLQGEIYKVDYTENITLIRDENGHVWGMKGTEVRPQGTSVIMTMDSMNTTTIVDDGIIEIKY
jgi:hypothetical protein